MLAEYLDETARHARTRGFILNEETTQDSQRWIFHMQIAREIATQYGIGNGVLVCDRGLLDNYVYFINKFGRDEALDLIVNEHMKTYNLLLKVPINPRYANHDPVRAIRDSFKREIDSLLESELVERKIPFQRYESLEKTIEQISKLRK